VALRALFLLARVGSQHRTLFGIIGGAPRQCERQERFDVLSQLIGLLPKHSSSVVPRPLYYLRVLARIASHCSAAFVEHTFGERGRHALVEHYFLSLVWAYNAAHCSALLDSLV
jgi:hypothetical protein